MVLWGVTGIANVRAYFTSTYNVVARFIRDTEKDDKRDVFMHICSTSSKETAERKAKKALKEHANVEIIEYKPPIEGCE